MRKSLLAAALVLLLASTGALAAQISGNYIEARTASVWVGACFANSEMGLTGQEALVGWQVTQGNWDGVPVAGLAVVGVIRASNTLGTSQSGPAVSMLIVDQKATPEQANALVSFAREEAPQLFSNVVRVARAPIDFAITPMSAGGMHEHGSSAQARLIAGNLARVETRAIVHDDATCANAELYYQPLANGTQAQPAFATSNEFKGNGLGTQWSNPNHPSAFVGTFTR